MTDMRPAYSESSTLVDEDGEDLPDLHPQQQPPEPLHSKHHPQTSHSLLAQDHATTKLNFNILTNQRSHEISTDSNNNCRDSNSDSHKNEGQQQHNTQQPDKQEYTHSHTDKQTSHDDDLSLLLKELSLHQYQSLFDEHEVNKK